MVKILAFDTTASHLGVALLDDEKILANETILQNAKHSEMLVPTIEAVLAGAKISYANIDLIAATNGPGSFTGSRVGLTVARSLRLATQKPLVLVNSCEALAFKYRQHSGKIFVALDASMDEFFCAEFFAENKKLTQLTEPFLARLDELSNFLPKEKFLLCGSAKNQVEKIARDKNFAHELSSHDDTLTADLVALLALDKFHQNPAAQKNLNPLYLRAPRIEPRKK